MGWDELLEVVDSKNKVIGAATKKEVYDKKLPHRIVHVFLLHPKTGQVYLQRRAQTVVYMPNCWCTSAAGHVGAGEKSIDAARRETIEEIGVACELSFIGAIPFVIDEHLRFLEIFLGYTSEGFMLDHEAVKEAKYFTLEQAKELVAKGEDIHPQFPPCLALLEKWLE